jgi:periplasmic divalent cation tolerance protein
MESTYFWPPKSNTLESNHEVVLIVKTLESKYQLVEDETKRLHTYENPCILSIPVSHIRKEYYDWLTGELEV